MKDKKKLNSCQKSAQELAICMHNKRRGDRPNLNRMDRFCLRNGSVTDEEDDLHRQTLLSRFWWGSCENGCTHMCD